MARIGDRLMVTDVDQEVLLIQNPGQDDEVVLTAFDPEDKMQFFVALREVRNLYSKCLFSFDEAQQVSFWFGYFYAHMGRQ